MTAMKLTDRELAIARGEDPDAIAVPVEKTDVGVSEVGDTAVEEAVVSDVTPTGTIAPVMTDTVSVDASAADDASAGKAGGTTWVDADVKLLASSYGLTDADLAEFNDLAAFTQFSKIMSRQYAKQIAQQAGQQTGQQAQAANQPVVQQAAAQQVGQQVTGQQADQPAKLVDPEYFRKNGYDEQTIMLAQGLREAQDQLKELASLRELAPTIQAQRQYIEEQEAKRAEAEAREFHQAADEIGPTLFGKAFDDKGETLDIDTNSDVNRRKLWEASMVVRTGIIERARQAGQRPVMPSTKAIVNTAAQMVFSNELETMRAQSRLEAIKTQSARRRPVAATAARQQPVGRSTGEQDDVKSIANDPRVVEFWNQAQQANGAV